jgi:hypothetical protein
MASFEVETKEHPPKDAPARFGRAQSLTSSFERLLGEPTHIVFPRANLKRVGKNLMHRVQQNSTPPSWGELSCRPLGREAGGSLRRFALSAMPVAMRANEEKPLVAVEIAE